MVGSNGYSYVVFLFVYVIIMDLAQKFYDVVIELEEKHWRNKLENLFCRTIWTFWKWYDDEEEKDCIISDTQEWINWEADYMDD